MSSNIHVDFIDLKRQHQSIRHEIEAGVLEVFAKQQFILGEEVARLEEELGRYLSTPASGPVKALGVSSGTDALLIALMALGVKPGDEVITSPFTFFATAGVIARLGAHPIFVDIEPDSFNLNPELVEGEGSDRTKVVMPVHLFGQCAKMSPLVEICRRRGWQLVEDACQAIGSHYHGQSAGTFGALGAFSFFPTKNLGGAGDGGLLAGKEGKLWETACALRTHGEGEKYHHAVVGINGRLDALQARIIRIKLKYLDHWNEIRRQHADYYDQALRGLPLKVPARFADRYHTFHQYTIRTDRRDELMRRLKERGVASMIYYPVPLHLQECFAGLGYQAGDCPEAEKACREVLSLPVYPELTREEQEYVVGAIRDFFAKS